MRTFAEADVVNAEDFLRSPEKKNGRYRSPKPKRRIEVRMDLFGLPLTAYVVVQRTVGGHHGERIIYCGREGGESGSDPTFLTIEYDPHRKPGDLATAYLLVGED